MRAPTGDAAAARRSTPRPGERRDPDEPALPPCPHLFEHYRSTYGCRAGDLPVAEDLAQRCVTVPLYPTMTVGQVDDVCDHIVAFLDDATPP